ncbi:MAG: HD-GYP domain-containing protein, partial [Lachnospiraceae bacterium]|nr:HD-GYP domain-containing protein [Lachnospiraceae bacterium]
ENDNTQNSFRYHSGDNTYMVTLTHLYDGKRKGGYQFFLTDDTKRQKYVELLNNFNLRLKEEVAQKTQHIVEMHEKLVLGMATMVESRDNSTGGHIRRTSEGVRILTDEIRKDNTLDLTDEFIRNVIKAAPMHDLGKIAVDDVILRKPGRFEPWEFEKMKAHAKEGARIVHAILEGTDDVEFHEIAENVAHYHHERWDGSGYPEGLKGEEIPLEARIMAIADVYDALVSKRVYKDSMPFDKADAIIMEGMGSQFDPQLERFYVAARPRLEAYYSEQEAVPDGSGLTDEGGMCQKH